MKLGLYFAVFNHIELGAALEKAAALQMDCIEISAHTGARFDVDEVLRNGRCQELKKMVESFGLTISAINMSADGQLLLGPHHSDTDHIFNGTPEEKIRYAEARMSRAGQLAHELEVSVITGFTGCEDYSRWFPWPDPEAWQRMENVFVERLDPILKEFETLGIKFAMECHPRQFVYNTETAIRSIELLGHRKNWGFNLDPANLLLALVDPVVFVAELGDRIFNVHAKDGELVEHNVGRSGLLANGPWDRPDRGFRFRIPGWGDIPWKRLITELAIRRYAGPLTIEHEDPTMGPMEGVYKAAEFLKPLIIKESFPGRWW